MFLSRDGDVNARVMSQSLVLCSIRAGISVCIFDTVTVTGR